jgi:glycosyltransferase involved in cell wall biosynthesis
MVIMKILHLLSSLEYGGAAKQALVLGRGLAATCDLRVCALHTEGPWAKSLRAAGLTVQSLHWTQLIGPMHIWRLRRLLCDLQPDRIHVWRPQALRMLGLAGREFLPRCIVSQALPGDRGPARLGMVDRWLLSRVFRIVAAGAAEAESLQRLGFGHERVDVIPPGVELEQNASELAIDGIPVRPDGRNHVRPAADVPGRRIVCLGNLRRNKGFCEALRAADYLTYSFADLHLSIIGSGPFLTSLKRFQEGVYHQNNVHFLGTRADAGAYLADADICWVPSLTATGRQVALEAMAAGRPVIASDLPHFREIIVDGVSGLLVPPGNKTALAGRTRQLFLDDAWRRRLGEAGRQRVTDHFAAADFVARCSALYGLDTSVVFLQTASRPRFSIATAEPSRNNAWNAATSAPAGANSERHTRLDEYAHAAQDDHAGHLP